MKIYAPVKDANGVYASVRFVNGIGETNDPHLIQWFRNHGYKVPIQDEPNSVICDVNEAIEVENEADEPEMMGYAEKQKPLEEMNPLELREYAKEHGFGLAIKNIRNKEKLLEIIRG